MGDNLNRTRTGIPADQPQLVGIAPLGVIEVLQTSDLTRLVHALGSSFAVGPPLSMPLAKRW